MGSHIVNGEFQSDKYPTCPPGKVPLSVKDPTAQELLWEYAQRRRMVDAEFSDDLETALRASGFEPPRFASQQHHSPKWTVFYNTRTKAWFGTAWEFYDDEEAALERYELLSADGRYPTMRPYYHPRDRSENPRRVGGEKDPRP